MQNDWFHNFGKYSKGWGETEGEEVKFIFVTFEFKWANFLLSLCNGIEKRKFDKSMGAIKSLGRMRFLRYLWSSILKMCFGICELREFRSMIRQSVPFDFLTINTL